MYFDVKGNEPIDSIPVFAMKYFQKNELNFKVPNGKLSQFLDSLFAKEGKDRTPWHLMEDFNGDGKVDYAGVLSDNADQLTVVIVYSKGKGYKHWYACPQCGSDNDNINIGIYPSLPGETESFPFDNMKEEERIDTAIYVGIDMTFFEQSSATVYWKKNKFKKIWTSD